MHYTTRTDIPPLHFENTNACTPHVRIHPVRSDVLILSKGNEDPRGSLILFDRRQLWDCYYYDLGTHGWDCTRGNVVLRLSEEDFIRIFGKITVISESADRRGPKYHPESEGMYRES